MVWHETCKCVCKLTEAICNVRQVWNENKCQCERKQDLINKLACNKGYIWNPSTCSCECDQLGDVGQYLDYQNCVCRKSLIDKMVKERTSVVEEDIETSLMLADCPSQVPYIVLFIVFLLISVIIGSVFLYYYRNWSNRSNQSNQS